MADSVSSESPGADAFALHCRGDVRLYRGEADCTPKSKKGRALLAILAAEERPLSRVKIIDLLWSDRQEEQARASLRTLLADLKQQFNSAFDELLVVDRERIALGPGVRTDLTDAALARPAGELFEGLDHIDPELDEWLRTEREKWANQHRTGAPASSSVGTAAPRRDAVYKLALAAALLLALAAATLLHFRPWAAPKEPVVAVLKFSDFTGKNALVADGFAEELRIQLAQQPRLQIIGRQSSEARNISSGGALAARSLLRASHVVEGAVLPGQPTRISVRLVQTRAGNTVWNQVVPVDASALAPVRGGLIHKISDQISQTVAQVGPDRAFAADPEAYVALFRARQLLVQPGPKPKLQARETLRPVLERFPNFVPALAAMAEATILSSDFMSFGGPIRFTDARREAQGYARRAIQQAPAYAPAYLALGIIETEPQAALRALRRAVELSPGDFSARRYLGRHLNLQHRHSAALPHLRAAVELNPAHVPANVTLMRALAQIGYRQEIRKLALRFQSVSDNDRDKLSIKSEAAIDADGAGAEALGAALAAHSLDPGNRYTTGFVFNAYFMLDAPTAALPYTVPGSLTEHLIKDDLAAVSQYVRDAGSDFWAMDYETDWAAEFLITRGRGRHLIAAYEQANRQPANTGRGAFYGYASLIAVLRDAGRKREADRLLKEYRAGVERIAKGAETNDVHFMRAEIAALEGNCKMALTYLHRSLQPTWHVERSFFRNPFDRFVFRCMRDDPQFHRLRAQLQKVVKRERIKAVGILQKNGRNRDAAYLRL